MIQTLESLKTRIDPSQITGFYPLLALFLIVGEGMGLLWLYLAGGLAERTVAGVLMTAIALVFLTVVLLAKSTEQQTSSVEQPTTNGPLSQSTPAMQIATQDQVENPKSQTVSAPDGSFVINKPPADWITRQLTLAELANENIGITDPSAKIDFSETTTVGQVNWDQKVLILESQSQMSVIPTPGTTTVDGRNLPSALETMVPFRLTILPMDRAQPPFFIERPFEHNFFVSVSQQLRSGVLTLQNLETRITQRRLLVAEFLQNIENATVNGKEGQSIIVANTIIGVEGELQDHQLLMNYAFMPEANDPDLARLVDTMKSLVDSFEPKEILNANEKQEEIDQLADRNFETILEEKGEEIFYAEFMMLLRRLKGEDMDDLDSRVRVMKVLEPFEVLAREVSLEDEEMVEELDELWRALRHAREGDASDLKAVVSELITVVTENANEVEEQPED